VVIDQFHQQSKSQQYKQQNCLTFYKSKHQPEKDSRSIPKNQQQQPEKLFRKEQEYLLA